MAQKKLVSFEGFFQYVVCDKEIARAFFQEYEDKTNPRPVQFVPKNDAVAKARELIKSGKGLPGEIKFDTAGRPCYTREGWTNRRKVYPIGLNDATIKEIEDNHGDVSRAYALEEMFWKCDAYKRLAEIAATTLEDIQTNPQNALTHISDAKHDMAVIMKENNIKIPDFYENY